MWRAAILKSPIAATIGASPGNGSAAATTLELQLFLIKARCLHIRTEIALYKEPEPAQAN
jgi:hypothetical protein